MTNQPTKHNPHFYNSHKIKKMQNSKTVILTKPFYTIANAAKILNRGYVSFYQYASRYGLFAGVNGNKMIKAETIQMLFAKFRMLDDCIINENANTETY